MACTTTNGTNQDIFKDVLSDTVERPITVKERIERMRKISNQLEERMNLHSRNSSVASEVTLSDIFNHTVQSLNGSNNPDNIVEYNEPVCPSTLEVPSIPTGRPGQSFSNPTVPSRRSKRVMSVKLMRRSISSSFRQDSGFGIAQSFSRRMSMPDPKGRSTNYHRVALDMQERNQNNRRTENFEFDMSQQVQNKLKMKDQPNAMKGDSIKEETTEEFEDFDVYFKGVRNRIGITEDDETYDELEAEKAEAEELKKGMQSIQSF